MDNENVRQVVVFNGVVGVVGSSGNFTNQTAVAASLGSGSMVNFCPEFKMKRVLHSKTFHGNQQVRYLLDGVGTSWEQVAAQRNRVIEK